MTRRPDPNVWRGKRVLVTGHTGFKGSWLCLLLTRLGAEVTGFALPPLPGDGAFGHLRIGKRVDHHEGDLRDAAAVEKAVAAAPPDIVLHLAAQAIVAESYRDPAGTFATNVQGTIHVLQALRAGSPCRAAVMVTSDKVYRNDGSGRPFREDDPLGGGDPYSASKAACEIAVASYAESFSDALPPLATARAGNVIGGGDFAAARLIPDLVRAEAAGASLMVRQPEATRPFQHVLDVLVGYLLLAENLAAGGAPSAVNFGPTEPEMQVRELLAAYGEARGRPVCWETISGPRMKEAPRLALDSSRASTALDWSPVLDGAAGLAATAEWYEAWASGGDLVALSLAQIETVL